MAADRARPALPISTDDFRHLRRMGLLYVDKTRYIFDLVQPQNQFVFLARPRRFGKSLLLSTLEALFQGDRALFGGTWIHDRAWDWTPHPVIRLNMAAWHAASAQDLKTTLAYQMADLHAAFGEAEPPPDMSADLTLGLLVQRLALRRQVAVLIDEYDAPIIQNLDNRAELAGIRNVLRGFYGALKANGQHLRFVFLTGVTRFARTSIFSGLNNLNDISHGAGVQRFDGFHG